MNNDNKKQDKINELKKQIKEYENQIDTLIKEIKNIMEKESEETSNYKKQLELLKTIDNKEAQKNSYNDFAMYHARYKRTITLNEERISKLKKNIEHIEEKKENTQQQLNLIYLNNGESEEKENG